MAKSKIKGAIHRLLWPLVKMLIRHGVPYGEFKDWARQAYVDVANKEFTLAGRKQTSARISVLTGINRKDVANLLKITDLSDPIRPTHQNRPSRIINGWLTDPGFNRQGEPVPLPFEHEDEAVSFTELVRRYSGDITVKAMMDELLRINAVVVIDGIVHLQQRAYLPGNDERIVIAGQAANDLLATLEHNLTPERTTRSRIQRTIAYDDIPVESLPEIRHLSEQQIRDLSLKINDWLSEFDRSCQKDCEGTGRARAGIGLYYFEETLEPGHTSEDKK